MARGRGTVAMAGVLGAAILGAAAWFLLGSGPEASRDVSGPEGDRVGASLPREAPDPAEPSPLAASPASAPPRAGSGSVVGRLVRGIPPLPVPGTVTLSGDGVPSRTATAGPDGLFSLEGAPRGRWLTLTASSEGLLTGRWPSIMAPLAGRLDLGDLVLGPALSLDVEVRDTSDRPVPGAVVQVERSPVYGDGYDWISHQISAPPPLDSEARAMTGADGRATVESVPPGSWMVVVDAKDHARGVAHTSLSEGLRTPLVRVVLLPAHRLEGTLSSFDGRPLPGGQVEGTPVANAWGASPAARTATADETGKWALDGLPPGEIALAVRPRPDLKIMVVTVEVPAVTRYDIRLPEGAEVRCRVLDDATAAPVAGAVLSLQTWSGNGGSSGQSFARAVTDATGTARVPGLPAGNPVQVYVKADGFIAWPDGKVPGETGQEPLASDVVKEVEARLHRGAGLRGRVLDLAGKGVAGASVQAHGWNNNRGTLESETVRTGTDGAWALSGLEPGKVLLQVQAQGFHQPDYPQEYWQALQSGTLPESCAATIPEEGEAVKDLVIAAGGSVEGEILLPDGKPAAGLMVFITSKGGGGAGGGSPTPSNGEGRFRVVGVKPGEELTVRAGRDGESGESAGFRLEEGGAVTGIRVELKAGCILAGRLRREDGSDLRGATLRLIAGVRDPNQVWNWEWQRRSAAIHPVTPDGTFRIEKLAPGKYTFLASAEGAGDLEGPVVEVASGDVKQDIEIVLRAGLTIAGVVRNAAGEPVAGAGIRVSKQEERQMYMGGQEQGVSVVTGVDGRFTLAGLTEGTWLLTAEVPGLLPGSATVKTGAADVVITLKAGGFLAGIVVDEADGRPIADLPVQVNPMVHREGPWRGKQGKTGADGTFRIEGIDPDEEFSVIAGAQWGEGKDGHAPKTVPGVKAGTTDLRIALAAGFSLAGRIQDEQGNALTGQFTVQAVGRKEDGTQDWSRQRWAQTEKGDGTFRLSGLPPGNYDLTVSDGGGGDWAAGSMKNLAAGAEGIVVVLRKGVVVKGRVVDDRGEAVRDQGGWVQFTGAGDPMGSSAQLQSDGTFTTQALDPNRTYDFSMSGIKGTMGATLKGVVPGGGEVVLRLSKGGTLSGRVVDGAGAGLKGVMVRAVAEGDDQRQPGGQAGTQSKEDGSFTLEGLGDFRFRVRAGGGDSDWQTSAASDVVGMGASDLVIVLRPGVVLTGRLVNGAGEPVAAQSLMSFGDGPDEKASPSWCRPGSDGSFTLKGLTPGKVKLRAWAGSAWVECGTFEAPAEGVVVTVPGNL